MAWSQIHVGFDTPFDIQGWIKEGCKSYSSYTKQDLKPWIGDTNVSLGEKVPCADIMGSTGSKSSMRRGILMNTFIQIVGLFFELSIR